MKKIIELLTVKRFLPLFVTQFLGAFNDNVYRNALAVLIMFHITTISPENKAMYSSMAIAIFMLPFFLFSATAGIIADKYNKARLIRIIKFSEMLVMALGVVGFMYGNVSLLLAVLFLTGLQSTFFSPLKYSILPEHLKDNELLAGNGLIEAGTFIAIVLGTVVGGLVISEHSASLGHASALVVGLAIISFITTLFIPATDERSSDEKPSFNFLKDTINILKLSKQNSRVHKVIWALAWFWLIGAVIMSQMLEMTKTVLTSNQEVYTMILTIFCFGIGVGSILCNAILKGRVTAKFVPISIFLISIFLLDLSYTLANFTKLEGGALYNVSDFFSSLDGYRIVIDFCMISLFGGIYSVPLYAIMQHDSPSDIRSKIIAASNIMNSAFMVLAGVVCTIMLKMFVISIPVIFAIFAVINLGVSLYAAKNIK